MTLYISVETSEMREMIRKQVENHRWTDSGFDIPIVEQNVDMSQKVVCFPLGVKVAALLEDGTPAPCLLLPRSSIYKTPFRLCNSIGLIDAGYRGEVKAMADNLDPQDETTIPLENGTRMLQICQHNFLPWTKIVITDITLLPAAPDSRGNGGFGSTGLQLENHPRT